MKDAWRITHVCWKVKRELKVFENEFEATVYQFSPPNPVMKLWYVCFILTTVTNNNNNKKSI